MWAVGLLVLVVGASAMTRNDCAPEHYENALRFFPEFASYPVNLDNALKALSAADDWQICEHDLMPRICVLDLLFGKLVNNFRSSKTFEKDLHKVGKLARMMEAKCITRNVPLGIDNNL